MRLPILPGLAALSIALMASGCTTVGGSGKAFLPETTSYAYLPNATQTQLLLRGIPKPSRQVAVAVYSFTDQTGQFKPSANGQTLPRAVTQGERVCWSRRCRPWAIASGSPSSSART